MVYIGRAGAKYIIDIDIYILYLIIYIYYCMVDYYDVSGWYILGGRVPNGRQLFSDYTTNGHENLNRMMLFSIIDGNW